MDESLFSSPTIAATPVSTSTPHEWSQHSRHHRSPLGSGSWYQDGFSLDPAYLASQEELRCMLFSIAESDVPVHTGTPNERAGLYGWGQSSSGAMKEVLSNRRRIKYLKNYVGEVAPWVFAFDLFFHH